MSNYHFIYLSINPSICLCIYLSIYQSRFCVHLSWLTFRGGDKLQVLAVLSLCPISTLSICLSDHLSAYLSIGLVPPFTCPDLPLEVVTSSRCWLYFLMTLFIKSICSRVSCTAFWYCASQGVYATQNCRGGRGVEL